MMHTETPAAGQRRLPAERRRRQLLAVATELFGTRGYHRTSMEDIADGAGVTKPVLYQHFPSKSRLYLELVESIGEELLAAVAADATAEEAPFARVLAGFRAYFRFVGERTPAFRLLFGGSARQSYEFADAVRRVEDSIASTIAGLIEADVDSEHRDLLGYAIVGLAEVTSRQWVQRREAAGTAGPALREEGDLLAERLADLVWAGLRALPGAR
jgi:AcrR family transcriptional regulator